MTNRRSPRMFALLTVCAALSQFGCGSSGLSSVTGSVMYKGKPAAGASVHFRPQGEKPEESMNFPIGVVDEEGNFELELAGVGSGAYPGKYNVLILWPEEKEAREAALAAKNAKPGKKSKKQTQSLAEARRDPKSDTDRLNYRYFIADKPLLSAEVKPGSNKLDPFELKD